MIETTFWNNFKYIYLLIFCSISLNFFVMSVQISFCECHMLRCFLIFYIILAKKLLSPPLAKFDEAITNEKLKPLSNSKFNNLSFYWNWKGWRLLYLKVSSFLLFLLWIKIFETSFCQIFLSLVLLVTQKFCFPSYVICFLVDIFVAPLIDFWKHHLAMFVWKTFVWFELWIYKMICGYLFEIE